jgi:hypothetical protein
VAEVRGYDEYVARVREEGCEQGAVMGFGADVRVADHDGYKRDGRGVRLEGCILAGEVSVLKQIMHEVELTVTASCKCMGGASLSCAHPRLHRAP